MVTLLYVVPNLTEEEPQLVKLQAWEVILYVEALLTFASTFTTVLHQDVLEP